MDRRPLNFVQITSGELLTRTLPFTKDELVINTTTGEIRYGEGMWHELAALPGHADVTVAVRVASTANVTIATALNAGDTVDDVTLADGDLVLLKNQTDNTENGIYTVAATPARATGYDTIPEFAGALVQVNAGTAGAGKLFRSTGAATGTIGSTAITFAEVVQGTLRFAALGQLGTLPSKTSYTATDVIVIEQADGTLARMAMSDLKTNMA
jgi:hypothetical protein